MDIRSIITNHFSQVAREQGRDLASLTDDLVLLDSGLDSLSFAIIVTRLEDAIGVDPSSISQDALFPVTFGDFVELYERTVQQTQ